MTFWLICIWINLMYCVLLDSIITLGCSIIKVWFESVCLCLTFSSRLFIIFLNRPRARPCSPFAQNTWASSSCHDNTGDDARGPPLPCCVIWNTARSASWTQWIHGLQQCEYLVVEIKVNVSLCLTAQTFRCYLCVPRLTSQLAELHQVFSDHRGEILIAVGVSHPGHQCVLSNRANSQNGLHQCKVTVSEQLGMLPPLAANIPQSNIREASDTYSK